MLAEVVQMYLASKGLPVLGDEYTLRNVPSAGRPDVFLSEQIAKHAASNPVTAAIHQAVRPYVDGLLVAHVGPQRLKAQIETFTGKATGVAKKKKKGNEIVRRKK